MSDQKAADKKAPDKTAANKSTAIDFEKMDGLVPGIVQDARTG